MQGDGNRTDEGERGEKEREINQTVRNQRKREKEREREREREIKERLERKL